MKFKIAPATIDWWYWFLTLISMVVGLGGRTEGFYAVVLISVLQCVHFLVKDGIPAMTTQVRLAYAAITVVALFDPTRMLFWMLPIGTVMVTCFDRCIIARVLKLMPWNKPPRAA